MYESVQNPVPGVSLPQTPILLSRILQTHIPLSRIPHWPLILAVAWFFLKEYRKGRASVLPLFI